MMIYSTTISSKGYISSETIVKISEIFRSKMARTLKRSICFIWNLEKFTHRGHNVLKIMYSNLQSMLKTLSPPVKMPKKVKT